MFKSHNQNRNKRLKKIFLDQLLRSELNAANIAGIGAFDRHLNSFRFQSEEEIIG